MKQDRVSNYSITGDVAGVVPDEAGNLARTLLILRNYEWIKDEAAAIGVSIIPLKGIDLLQTVYAEKLDRRLRDIDILCRNEHDCRKLVERLCQDEEYRLEFPFSLRSEALKSKKKVSLLSCSTLKVNVDVHTAIVTKKFFAQTIGTFNHDAQQRCHLGHLDDLDRWLFLAQHAAFHLFSDYKWTHDLFVLYNGVPKQHYAPIDRQTLNERARQYGFRRVMLAAFWQMWTARIEPHGKLKGLQHEWMASLSPTPSEQRFLRFVRHFARPFSRSIADRFIAAYWEFAFIDHRSNRFKMWLQLIIPSPGTLTNIYKINTTPALLLFYPLNLVVTAFTSTLFWACYAAIAIFGRKAV